MKIWSMGMNHKTAPLAIREKVAVSIEELPYIVKNLTALPGVYEVVLLSTCNRTELYCVADNLYQIVRKLIERGFDLDELKAYTYTHVDLRAVSHLMQVGCGVDSMVVGESEILGQVKLAYKSSCEAGGVGKYLGRMFQRAFAASKLVRLNTGIGLRPVSVTSVVIRLANQLFSDFSESSILILGAGSTSAQLLKHLASIDVKHIYVANRTLEKARSLVSGLGIDSRVTCIELSELKDYLTNADVVLGATSSSDYIITKDLAEQAMKARKFKPMCFIDLAVPRDISPGVNDIEKIFSYTVDDLKQVIAKNKDLRKEASSHASKLIEDEAAKYMRWFYAQEYSEIIAGFRYKFEDKKNKAVARALNQISQGAPVDFAIEKAVHSIAQQFLHTPTLTLKEATEGGDRELITNIEKLFKLRK